MNKIKFFYENVTLYKIKKKQLKNYIKELVAEEGYISGDINVIFCNDEYLLEMNKKYLVHDYYTDIITFNYVQDKTISGDLFISLERVADNAGILKTDKLVELHRVIFHGILHLAGYNDKNKSEIRQMRFKEDYYLDRFGIQKQ